MISILEDKKPIYNKPTHEMKKLILLLFIPLVSFGQVNSYTDLQKINSLEQFKRIAIENGYEKSKYQNDVNIVEYYLNPSFNDKELTNADGAAFYYVDNKDFRFVFKENFLGVNIDTSNGISRFCVRFVRYCTGIDNA